MLAASGYYTADQFTLFRDRFALSRLSCALKPSPIDSITEG